MVGQNLSLKLAVGMVLLALLQGILKTFWTGFPLTEVMSFQSGIILAWFTKRGITDVKGFKYGNDNAATGG